MERQPEGSTMGHFTASRHKRPPTTRTTLSTLTSTDWRPAAATPASSSIGKITTTTMCCNCYPTVPGSCRGADRVDGRLLHQRQWNGSRRARLWAILRPAGTNARRQPGQRCRRSLPRTGGPRQQRRRHLRLEKSRRRRCAAIATRRFLVPAGAQIGLTVDYFINVNGTAAGGLDYGPFYGQPAQTPADNQDNVVDAHFHGLAARGSNAGVIFDWKNHDDDDVLQLLPDGSWFLQGRRSG